MRYLISLILSLNFPVYRVVNTLQLTLTYENVQSHQHCDSTRRRSSCLVRAMTRISSITPSDKSGVRLDALLNRLP